MGRPPKAGRTRNKSIKVALTDDELADVKMLASSAGHPAMSDYLRALIRADAAVRGIQVLTEGVTEADLAHMKTRRPPGTPG